MKLGRPHSKKRAVLINFKTCVGFLLDIVISYTTPITPNSHDAPTIVNTSSYHSYLSYEYVLQLLCNSSTPQPLIPRLRILSFVGIAGLSAFLNTDITIA